MRTREEITNELNSTIDLLKGYHKAYHLRKIPFDIMCTKSSECHSKIEALKWVLAEND